MILLFYFILDALKYMDSVVTWIYTALLISVQNLLSELGKPSNCIKLCTYNPFIL